MLLKTTIIYSKSLTFLSLKIIELKLRMAFSVECKCKFFKCIFSTPVAFMVLSKLLGPQGCSDDKNCLDFPSIFIKICGFRSLILVSLYVLISREAVNSSQLVNGVIFLDQSQLFAMRSNQWDCRLC